MSVCCCFVFCFKLGGGGGGGGGACLAFLFSNPCYSVNVGFGQCLSCQFRHCSGQLRLHVTTRLIPSFFFLRPFFIFYFLFLNNSGAWQIVVRSVFI